MRPTRRLWALLLVLVVAAVTAATAAADPTGSKKSSLVTIQCGTTTYQAVVNGNGAWSPAHDLASNSILIPIAFGEQNGVFTDPSGTPHPFTDPPRAKGSSSPNGAPLIDCTFHIEQSFPDGASIVVDGSVTGFVTPA
jgi:hypothetical protein